MLDQRAVAAADVQHARAGRDHAGDQREVDAHFFMARSCQPGMLRAAGEEAAQRAVELRLVQQEGVVALVGLDLDEARRSPPPRSAPCDGARFSPSGTASPR